MYALIDITNYRAIATAEAYTALAALAYIQFANVDTTIVPLDANREFAQFDDAQLHSIAKSLNLILMGKDYSDNLKGLRYHLVSSRWIHFNYPVERVVEQADYTPPSYDKPLAFNPDSHIPRELAAWSFEPNRNRRREDSSYGSMFGDKHAHTKRDPASAINQPPPPPPPRRK